MMEEIWTKMNEKTSITFSLVFSSSKVKNSYIILVRINTEYSEMQLIKHIFTLSTETIHCKVTYKINKNYRREIMQKVPENWKK